MIGQKTLFSSKSDDWETPQDFFDKLDKEFNFKVDMACNKNNKKCFVGIGNINSTYALAQVYHNRDDFWWCNPPYSDIKSFLHFRECHDIKSVFLLPSRTDTRWFHDYIYNKLNVDIRFIKGRLKFSGAKFNAPFPSMLVIFKRED